MGLTACGIETLALGPEMQVVARPREEEVSSRAVTLVDSVSGWLSVQPSVPKRAETVGVLGGALWWLGDVRKQRSGSSTCILMENRETV